LSIEKLCPVLSGYVVSDWRQGCERCIEILRYGGMGHTMAIHSENQDVILQFGLKKPAFRICVNTPTTHGSIGLTTGLDPAMTLGCGGWGGNITSDNISPRHLLNIKRLAYEVRPAAPSAAMANGGADLQVGPYASAMKGTMSNPLPKAPAAPEPRGISAQALSARIDAFLTSRGYVAPTAARTPTATESAKRSAVVQAPAAASQSAAEFVCEDDVRAALLAGRKLLIGEKTIITPSARDLGESAKVFVQASWPN
jgi:acetaldehyde dehydrogenase (acetylating)